MGPEHLLPEEIETIRRAEEITAAIMTITDYTRTLFELDPERDTIVSLINTTDPNQQIPAEKDEQGDIIEPGDELEAAIQVVSDYSTGQVDRAISIATEALEPAAGLRIPTIILLNSSDPTGNSIAMHSPSNGIVYIHFRSLGDRLLAQLDTDPDPRKLEEIMQGPQEAIIRHLFNANTPGSHYQGPETTMWGDLEIPIGSGADSQSLPGKIGYNTGHYSIYYLDRGDIDFNKIPDTKIAYPLNMSIKQCLAATISARKHMTEILPGLKLILGEDDMLAAPAILYLAPNDQRAVQDISLRNAFVPHFDGTPGFSFIPPVETRGGRKISYSFMTQPLRELYKASAGVLVTNIFTFLEAHRPGFSYLLQQSLRENTTITSLIAAEEKGASKREKQALKEVRKVLVKLEEILSQPDSTDIIKPLIELHEPLQRGFIRFLQSLSK